VLRVDREQVMAYRVAAHGLHRAAADPATLAVFDLGVQDNQRGSVPVALAARVTDPIASGSLADDPQWTLAWTHRGAPHVHRGGDMSGVVSALVPLDEADAVARMGWQRGQVAGAGMPATEALHTAARAIREVVTAPMVKGAVSAAVTAIIPPGLSTWCRGCRATHIMEQLMRLAAPHGGVRLEPGATPATLAPMAPRPRASTTPRPDAAREVALAYLVLHGPATPADVAGFVGTTRATVAERMWPPGLAEVLVDGRPAFLPADCLSTLENPPEPTPVRLLPPLDPLVQGRDRDLLVPERALHKEIWKILGNPGVVLADGEIVGTWRAKAAGRARLGLTIAPFHPLGPACRASVAGEAERVAAARGYPDVTITWSP